LRFIVVGVIFFSIFVGVVGGDRHTAVMNVVVPENVMPTERPKVGIVEVKKDGKPIVRLNNVVEWD
jgi:hypothetical protein